MTELEASGVGEPPPYMIFLVVFLFFLTGLLGFLICKLLKEKGYRCRTGDVDDEEEEEKLGENEDDENEDNQDTVEQILKCIIENEANMEAFNEMLGNHNVCVRHDPRLRKESIGGVPPHLHTVHSGTDHNSCHLCAQVRSKKGRRQSRTPRFKQRPREQTVFSVGRFRVIHTDKKLHGGPNALAVSGDQLDESQDSEDRKEGGYNLRSMFKEARPPSENPNGVAANVGKRKKSITIFGVRRSSDPIGLKVKEGTRSETGGIKFATQQPPPVLEEPVQAENIEPDPECDTKSSSKPETEAALAVNLPCVQSKKQAYDSSPGPLEDFKLSPRPEPKPSNERAAATAPTSLSVSSERTLNVDKIKMTEEVYNPGPIQTSTPIAPIMASISGGITPGQSESYSLQGFSVAQTPPDPSSSPDLEPGIGAGLTLISLGSSPSSAIAESLSPQSSSRNTPLKAAQLSFSPTHISSPKLLPDQEKSNPPTNISSSLGQIASPLQAQSPSIAVAASPILDTMLLSTKSPSYTAAEPNPPFTSSPCPPMKLSITEPALGDTIPKTEKKRAGILKTAKLSAVATEESRSSGLSSPSGQLFKDRPSSLSPSSPSSPSSPQRSRITSVTIVKVSPDSKREFPVVTVVEKEEPSSPMKGQRGETSEHVFKLGKEEKSPAVCEQRGIPVFSVGQSESQSRESSGIEISPTLSQEKDVMMEMEDIKDCRVAQEDRAEGSEEEGTRMMPTQPEQDQEVKSEDGKTFKTFCDEKERSDTTQ
ncbi:RELT-like protein 2 isoform 1-T4 [Odontesthes bonariensis]|uniref:RELT-like protein 2 n=1 Tax=Odontesthes bonariensis TaxID=219752 RepID=UPI003F58BB44